MSGSNVSLTLRKKKNFFGIILNTQNFTGALQVVLIYCKYLDRSI